MELTKYRNGKIHFNGEEFRCDDWADMSVLCTRLNRYLNIIGKQARNPRSTNFNQISRLLDIPVEDLLDAPILTMSYAGDTGGLELLGGDADALYFIPNDYIEHAR